MPSGFSEYTSGCQHSALLWLPSHSPHLCLSANTAPALKGEIKGCPPPSKCLSHTGGKTNSAHEQRSLSCSQADERSRSLTQRGRPAPRHSCLLLSLSLASNSHRRMDSLKPTVFSIHSLPQRSSEPPDLSLPFYPYNNLVRWVGQVYFMGICTRVCTFLTTTPN